MFYLIWYSVLVIFLIINIFNDLIFEISYLLIFFSVYSNQNMAHNVSKILVSHFFVTQKSLISISIIPQSIMTKRKDDALEMWRNAFFVFHYISECIGRMLWKKTVKIDSWRSSLPAAESNTGSDHLQPSLIWLYPLKDCARERSR